MMDQLAYDEITNKINSVRQIIETQRRSVIEIYWQINEIKGSLDAMERLLATEFALNEAAGFLKAALLHYTFDTETSGSVKEASE